MRRGIAACMFSCPAPAKRAMFLGKAHGRAASQYRPGQENFFIASSSILAKTFCTHRDPAPAPPVGMVKLVHRVRRGHAQHRKTDPRAPMGDQRSILNHQAIPGTSLLFDFVGYHLGESTSPSGSGCP